MIFLFFKLNQVLGDYSHCLATTHNKREREREREIHHLKQILTECYLKSVGGIKIH